MMQNLSLAQKVRLWFIVGTEALSAILIIVAITSLNYYPDLGVTEASGDTAGVIGWILISQVAVVTLGIITFYRLLHPKAPQNPTVPPPYQYQSAQYPSAPPGPGSPQA